MPRGLHPFRRRFPLPMAPTSASHSDFPFQPHRPLIITVQGASSIPSFPHSSPLTWPVFRSKLGGGFSLKPLLWSGGGQLPPLTAALTVRVRSSIYYLPWQILAFFHLQTNSPRAGLLHHHKSHCVEILSKKMHKGNDRTRILNLCNCTELHILALLAM